MHKVYLFILIGLLFSVKLQAQQDLEEKSKKEDSIPPVTLYKIITVQNDTTYLDTTLTIQKDYKFNYLRKDNFELLPFF